MMKLEYFLTTYIKINYIRIKEMNVRPDNIKPQKENLGNNLLDIGLRDPHFHFALASKIL